MLKTTSTVENFAYTHDSDRLCQICEAYGIVELSLFGSILRDDFSGSSDVDLLVQFAEEAQHTLFDKARLIREFEQLFGRPVDLVNKSALEKSRNFYRKDSILNGARRIYAA